MSNPRRRWFIHSALVGFSFAAPRAAKARKMREMRRGNIAPSKSVGGSCGLEGSLSHWRWRERFRQFKYETCTPLKVAFSPNAAHCKR